MYKGKIPYSVPRIELIDDYILKMINVPHYSRKGRRLDRELEKNFNFIEVYDEWIGHEEQIQSDFIGILSKLLQSFDFE